MHRYKIEEAKYEEGDQMLTCTPPVMHPVIGSIRYSRDDGKTGWLYCLEVIGFHEFYASDKDVHKELLDAEDEDLVQSLNIEDFDGLNPYDVSIDDVDAEQVHEAEQKGIDWIGECYGDMMDNPAFNLISIAIKLSDSYNEEEASEFIASIKGKFADEIPIQSK